MLGYRNPQATANLINRWRVRAGLRSLRAERAHDTRVIFSGDAPGEGSAEAQLMADYATSVATADTSYVPGPRVRLGYLPADLLRRNSSGRTARRRSRRSRRHHGLGATITP
ncbi:hypothetical protein ACFY8B_25625 [Streptomyces sp. NPDC012751]|uniref:hypothetical protein n=1 Tax=Streptomyces sp. NPDC012751 TaxID=3364846 RepID=UPI003697264E